MAESALKIPDSKLEMPNIEEDIKVIKQSPLKDRESLYQEKKAKLLKGSVLADVAFEREKSAREVGVKQAGAEESQRQTLLQEKEMQEGIAKRDKYALPTFTPSQEDLGTYAQLASSIMTMGLLIGAGGKSSAKIAVASMTGMLKGWKEGRKDLYERESRNFEKESARISNIRKDIQSDLDRAMKLWPTKRKDAIALIETARYKAGTDSVLGAMLYKGNYDGAMKLLESARKADEVKLKHEQDIAARAETARLTAQYRASRLAQGSAEKTQKATQQQFIVQRSVNSLGGVASALESIVNLPEGATTGWLPNLQTKDGMFNAVRNQIGRKISKVDAEMMNTLFSGIGRNLASIEASGTATGLTGLATQLQSGVYINAGVDDPFKVAIKLADIRRIASENIRPSIESGLMPKQQAETAQKLVERIEKIIPYTTVDVVNAYRQAKSPGKKTIGEAASQVVQPSEIWSDADEKRLKELEEKSRGPK